MKNNNYYTSIIMTIPDFENSPEANTDPIKIPMGETSENVRIEATKVFQFILDFIISIPRHKAIMHLWDAIAIHP